MSLETYRKFLDQKAPTKREREISQTKKMFARRFPDMAGFQVVEIDGREAHLIISTKSTQSTDINQKRIIGSPGESFVPGETVHWGHTYWLITGVDVDIGLYYAGNMERCNDILRWQDLKTGEIRSQRGVFNSTAYAGTDITQVVSTSDRVFKFTLPYNEHTRQLDINRRFMLETIGDDPKTYTCINVDFVSQMYDEDDGLHGIITLMLKHDQKRRDSDNIALGICDYFEPGQRLTPPDGEGPSLTIRYQGEPAIKIGGSAKTFTAELQDEDGTIIDTAITWDVAILPEYAPYIYINVEIENSRITLKAQNKAALLGTFIVLTARTPDNGPQATLTVKVVGIFE